MLYDSGSTIQASTSPSASPERPRFGVRESTAHYAVTPEPTDSGPRSEPAGGGPHIEPTDSGPHTEPAGGAPITEPAGGGPRTEPAGGGPLTEPAGGAGCTADSGLPEAGTVHALIQALHGLGNEVRLRFLDALRMLYDSRLYHELGYPTYTQYADRELGLQRSTALEYVRVVRALDGLPRLRVLFAHGQLSWEQVRAIARVAAADTELAWIELAFEEPVAVLLAELREANRTGRHAPREQRYGLPNLMIRIWFDLTIEDNERLRSAFRLVNNAAADHLRGAADDAGDRDPVGRDPVGGDTDGTSDPRPALVRWADGILSGAIPVWPAVPAGGDDRGAHRPTPAQTILYRTCPECRQSTLDTAEGPIAVAPGRVTELEPVANRVTIADGEETPPELMPPGEVDKPNSQALARQVLHRDGLCCSNPGCGNRRNLQAHHIVFRSLRGRTVLNNEVAVCDVCHALLHQGLLEVMGSPDGKLDWHRRPLDTGVMLRESVTLLARLAELDAEIAAAKVGRAEPGGSGAAGAMSAGADTRDPSAGADTQDPSAGADTRRPSAGDPYDAARVRDLAEGMRAFGCTLAEGKRRVRDAITALLTEQRTSPGASGAYTPLDDADILLKALRG